MLKLYFAVFGTFQVLAGLIEMIAPHKSYGVWKKWVFNRVFLLHGLLLITAGFPFFFYKGFLSGIIFWIGVFMTLTGPFLLIYPEKIREAFITAEKEFKPKDLRKMVYLDAVFRIFAGSIVLIAYIRDCNI